MEAVKETKRTARHKRIRSRVIGTKARPRLCIHRSLNNMELQLIDDTSAETILSLSTAAKGFKEKIGYGGNIKAADFLGGMFAKLAQEKNIKEVVCDRGGYAYHGRVKALCESLRKGGLVF